MTTALLRCLSCSDLYDLDLCPVFLLVEAYITFPPCCSFTAHTQAWIIWVSVLDWQPACCDLRSRSLPPCTSLASCLLPPPPCCCLVGVAMAPSVQKEASHTASCVLFTEGRWRGIVELWRWNTALCVDWWSALGSSRSLSTFRRGTVTLLVTFYGDILLFLYWRVLPKISFLFFRHMFWTQPFLENTLRNSPSCYAHLWIPVAHWLAHDLRSSLFMSATGRTLLSVAGAF